jgi:hypothetical protein
MHIFYNLYIWESLYTKAEKYMNISIIQSVPWGFIHCDISWNNRDIIILIFFLIKFTVTRTTNVSFLIYFNVLVKKLKNIFFYLIIFKKIEDSHFIEFIFLKILTFQHFDFINLLIFNIFSSLKKKLRTVVSMYQTIKRVARVLVRPANAYSVIYSFSWN